MNSKYTLIINYRSLHVGGIETYLYSLSKYLSKIGGRIIWLCDDEPIVSDSFSAFFLSNKVERVITQTRGKYWFKHEPISFSKKEKIVILSFTPFEMCQAIELKGKYPQYNINCFYVVPNFTGNNYYIERFFKGWLNKFVINKMKKILNIWEENSYIRFFDQKHIDALEMNYKFKIKEHDTKILGPVNKQGFFDYNLAKKRSKREQFNLITVGRFDFPHKGYILGLIRSYGQLKKYYPHLTLTIIGYGEGEPLVKKEIDKLPKKHREDIKLIGEVAPDKLNYYFDKSHLNIGVAGAVRAGARSGLISLPSRHYCYECEVYGYLPEYKDMNLSTDPGNPVEKFIEEVINMDDQTYIEMCKRSYDTFAVQAEDPLYFFKTKNIVEEKDIKQSHINFIKYYRYMCKAKVKITQKIKS